ncbi:putative ribonuclease H-like domain-containing protein [Tanacetum coccineum]
MTYPSPKRNMVPKAVLMRYGLVSLATARPVNTAQPKTTVNSARPMINIFNKAHSTVRRPINNKTSTKNSNFNQRVNTVSGYVAFGGNPKGGKITGKGTIKTSNLDFENAYFVRELQFNLFSVSQMCDKKNSVLFNDTECIVLSPNFKLTDESHVLLKVPRKNNMYSVNLNNIIPKGGLTCLFVKATSDESKLWHRRLGHINFKTMNKLVKGNLVRGLPLKLFENDQTCVACQKGKQYRASCKSKTVIRCDNGTEFKNKEINLFYERKGIKREFSVARTPKQNGVAERKNRTQIEAIRTMLADSKLLTTFWAEAVNTACYVLRIS